MSVTVDASLMLAYLGPGLGGGVLAILIGLLLSIGLALFAVVWYPIKSLLGLSRKQRNAYNRSKSDLSEVRESQERGPPVKPGKC